MSHRMPIFLFSAFFLCLAILSGIVNESEAQSGNSQNQSNSFLKQFNASGSDQIYFVDELSLEIINAGNIPSDYVTEDYLLGPNDLISVHLEGIVPVTARGIALNSQGTVFLPLVGQVQIGNRTLQQSKEILNSAYEKHLNEFQLNVTIERPRGVSIHLVGDIDNPGKYQIPPGQQLDTILRSIKLKRNSDKESNSFEESLGNRNRNPSDFPRNRIPVIDENNNENSNISDIYPDLNKISIRNLEIIRSDSTSHKADLVRYFSTGENQYNPYLYDGDVIIINKRSTDTPRSSISGAVQRPNEFEYRPEDTISALIKIGGGRLDNAITDKAYVYRRTETDKNAKKITVEESQFNQFSLNPNDRVVIPYNKNKKQTAGAWVIGEAVSPGNFPIDETTTTVADLIEMAGGLNSQALPNAAYIIREMNIPRETENSAEINIDDLKRTSDQLRQGFEYLDLEENLGTDQRMIVDLSDTASLNEIRVLDGDRLYIPADLQTVTLFGQVKNPGNYPYHSTNSVEDYLGQANGLNLAADPDRVFVIKAGSKAWQKPENTELESGDMIFVDRIPFDELDAKRNYEVQLRNAKRQDRQVLLAAISTIAAVVTTTVVVIRR